MHVYSEVIDVRLQNIKSSQGGVGVPCKLFFPFSNMVRFFVSLPKLHALHNISTNDLFMGRGGGVLGGGKPVIGILYSIHSIFWLVTLLTTAVADSMVGRGGGSTPKTLKSQMFAIILYPKVNPIFCKKYGLHKLEKLPGSALALSYFTHIPSGS